MSITLNGTDQYGRVDISDRNSANPWTFFCMVKFDNLATGHNQTYFGAHRSATSYRYIAQRMLNTSDTIAGRFRVISGETVAEDTGLTLSTGTWYRVLFEWNETTKTAGIKINDRTMV